MTVITDWTGVKAKSLFIQIYHIALVVHFRLELNAHSFSLNKSHHLFRPHISAWYHMWWGTCQCRKGFGDWIPPGCIGLSHVPDKYNWIPILSYTTSRIISQAKLPSWCVRTEPLVSGVFQALGKPGQEDSRRLQGILDAGSWGRERDC